MLFVAIRNLCRSLLRRMELNKRMSLFLNFENFNFINVLPSMYYFIKYDGIFSLLKIYYYDYT